MSKEVTAKDYAEKSKPDTRIIHYVKTQLRERYAAPFEPGQTQAHVSFPKAYFGNDQDTIDTVKSYLNDVGFTFSKVSYDGQMMMYYVYFTWSHE